MSTERGQILDELHHLMGGVRPTEEANAIADAVRAAPLASEQEERELWNRMGAILRARDEETYKLLRSLAVSLASLLDAPRAS